MRLTPHELNEIESPFAWDWNRPSHSHLFTCVTGLEFDVNLLVGLESAFPSDIGLELAIQEEKAGEGIE